jgi:hypothetical protein
MSSPPRKKVRLKADVPATSGGPDPLTEPLTKEEQELVERVGNDEQGKARVAHEIRLMKRRMADLKGTLQATIKAGEEVEVVAYGGHIVETPEAERGVWVRNSKGLNGWTQLGNLELPPGSA